MQNSARATGMVHFVDDETKSQENLGANGCRIRTVGRFNVKQSGKPSIKLALPFRKVSQRWDDIRVSFCFWEWGNLPCCERKTS